MWDGRTKRSKLAPSRPSDVTSRPERHSVDAISSVFHGILYRNEGESNKKWVGVAQQGFVALFIRHDLAKRYCAVVAAQDGNVELLSMPVSSNVKVKRSESFVQWNCAAGDCLTSVVYGVHFPKQEVAVKFEESLCYAVQHTFPQLLLRGSRPSSQQVTVVQPNDLVIKVHLPAKQTTTVAVSPSMSVHDFLVYVCERRHLKSSSHGLSLPPDCLRKRSRQYDGRTPIGSLGTHEVHLVQLPNQTEVTTETAARAMGSRSTSEHSHLLVFQVYLPCFGEKATVSVPPSMLVRELLALICEKRGLDPSVFSLELLHSGSRKKEVDSQCRVGDLKVNQVKLIDKRGDFRGRAIVSSTITEMSTKKPGFRSEGQCQVEAVQPERQQASSKRVRPFSSKGYGHINLDVNVLAPEWDRFFDIVGLPLSEAADSKVAEAVNRLVINFGGLEAVLKHETVCSALCQSSDFLLLQKRRSKVSSISSVSTQGSDLPRKKAAPLPPAFVTKGPLRPVGTEPLLVTGDVVRSHPRASSTPIAFQAGVLPKIKRKAPSPPLKHENVGLQINRGPGSCVSTNSSSSASKNFSSTSDVDYAPVAAVSDDVFVGRNPQHLSTSSTLDMESCQHKGESALVGNGTSDEVFVSSMTGNTGVTGGSISTDSLTRGCRSGADTAYFVFDLDLPPPPPIEECSVSLGNVDDLPPPPLNTDEELALAIYDDIPLPLPGLRSNDRSTSCQRDLQSNDVASAVVNTPRSRQLVSRESVHSSFEVEMDELSSILDSVVAEAEAYLTTPKESTENVSVMQKSRYPHLGKVPPPVAKKPEMPSNGRVVKCHKPLQRQANAAEDTKADFTQVGKQTIALAQKGLLSPPKPVPYAESPAAKRRSRSSQSSCQSSTEKVSSLSSLKSICSTPPQAKETPSVSVAKEPSVISRSPGHSHKYRSPTSSSPVQPEQGEMNSPVSRARSSTLPARIDAREGNVTPCSPLAIRHLLLSDSTGTVRGVKGQVKKRVGSFPDVSEAIVDMKKKRPQIVETTRNSDSNGHLPEKLIGRNGQNQFNTNEPAMPSNVKEELARSHAQTQPVVFCLPSVTGERGNNTIVFSLPPPPCEPPPAASSPLQSDELRDLDNISSFRESLPCPPTDLTEVVLDGSGGEINKSVPVHVSPCSSDFPKTCIHGYEYPADIPDYLPPQPDIAAGMVYHAPDNVPNFLPPPPLAASISEDSGSHGLGDMFAVSFVKEGEACQREFSVGDTATPALGRTLLRQSCLGSSERARLVVGFDQVTSYEGAIISESSLLTPLDATTSEDGLQQVEVNDRKSELQLSVSRYCQEELPVEIVVDDRNITTTGDADSSVEDTDAGVIIDESDFSQSLSLPPPPAELLTVADVDLDSHIIATESSQVLLSLPAVPGWATPEEVLVHDRDVEVGFATEPDRQLPTPALPSLRVVPITSEEVECNQSKQGAAFTEQRQLAQLLSTSFPHTEQVATEPLQISCRGEETGHGATQSHVSLPSLLLSSLSSVAEQYDISSNSSVKAVANVSQQGPHRNVTGQTPMWSTGEQRHNLPNGNVSTASIVSRPEENTEGLETVKREARAVVTSNLCEISDKQYFADATSRSPHVDKRLLTETPPGHKELLLFQDEEPPLPKTPPPLPEKEDPNDVEEMNSVFGVVVDTRNVNSDSSDEQHRDVSGSIIACQDAWHREPSLTNQCPGLLGGEQRQECSRRQDYRSCDETDVCFESDVLLVKARSEDQLLASNHSAHLRSRSGSSLGNALLTPRADRRIGKLRWNSEVDLSVLYGEYRDVYGEVLSDIRRGNNYANLRKVEVELGPRRKSIATTYTGMAAALVDAMKIRRIRLTDSLGPSQRRSVVCEDDEEEEAEWD